MRKFLFLLFAFLLTVTPQISTAAPLVASDIQSPTITRRVSTMADLQALSSTPSIQSVYVEGRTAAGDGYQGTFYWLSGDQSANPLVLADTFGGIYVKPASPGDGSGGVWVRGFTGAVRAKWFNVAAGRDISDELRTCLSVAGARSTVIVDPGDYYVDGSLIDIPNGVKFIANGAKFTLSPGSYGAHAYFFGNSTSITYTGSGYEDNIVISGAELDGNRANVTFTESYGVTGFSFFQVNSPRLENVKVSNFPVGNSAGYGAVFWYCNNYTVNNVDIRGTDRQPLLIWESTGDIYSAFLGDSYGRDSILVSSFSPEIYQGSVANIYGGEFDNSGTILGPHVVRFSGKSSGSINNSRIVANNAINGIYISDVYDHKVTISGVSILNALYGVLIESNGYKQTTVENSFIYGVNGIRALAAGTDSSILIKGNRIVSTSQGLYLNYTENQRVIDNIIDGGSEYVFMSNMVRYKFSGNTILNLTNASYAANIAGSPTSIPIISGNDVVGNTSNIITVSHNALFTDNDSGYGGSGIKLGKIGSGFLWRDTTGNLRISPTEPAAIDTDGVIVGTQN